MFKRRKLEEVVFLLHHFRRPPTLGAGRARPHGIYVQFVEYAILAGVMSLVDIAVVADLPEECLHPLLMLVRRGTDEIVVAQPHPVPERAELGRNFVGELLRSLARSLRRPLNLLPMLIGASKEERLEAHHALAARHGVACNRGVRVPDMWACIHVINWRRDVELLAHNFPRESAAHVGAGASPVQAEQSSAAHSFVYLHVLCG